MDRLKGRFSISQGQPLNFSSGCFSASTVGSYLDFNLTNINKDVLEEIYVVFNVTNTSTTVFVFPLPTPLWIQSYSVWQGSNQWESQVPSEIILLENLLNLDDVKLNKYGPSMLINPLTGQHNSAGIAAGATGNYYVKFPVFTVTSYCVLTQSKLLCSYPVYLNHWDWDFIFLVETTCLRLQHKRFSLTNVI